MTEWTMAFRPLVDSVPPDEWIDAVAELARADVILRQRITAPPASPRAADEWVDATEAGRLCGMSRSWCYESRELLGGRHIGGAVRFSTKRIRQYLEGRLG